MRKMRGTQVSIVSYYLAGMLIAGILCTFQLQGQEIDSLWAVWDDHSLADTNRMRAMKEISWQVIFIDADSGANLANQLLGFASEKNNLVFQAAALKTLGLSSYLKGNYDQGLSYYETGIEKAIAAGDSVELSNIYNNIGVTNKALGNYDKALEAHFKSLNIKEKLALKESMAHSYNNIGILYSSQYNMPMAIEYFHKHLRICEDLQMTNQAAFANLNIGLMYLQQENYDKAFDYLIDSEETFQSLDNKRALSTLYNSIGIAYKGKGDLDKATGYYQKALTLANELNDKALQSRLYRNLGNVYELKGKFDEAMVNFRKNLDMMTALGEKDRIATAKIDIGVLYLELDRPSDARKWCEDAYGQAKEYGYLREVMESCKCLNKAHESLGDITNAYRFQEEYYLMRDSLEMLEDEVEVERMVIRYNFEKQYLADSLAMVEEQLKTKLVYQENLNKEKNRQRTILFAGIVILVITGTLYNRLLFVRRSNKRLAEKNKIIEYEKQRAEDSEHAKELFFSNVSHELRTPLTLILGPLENIINKTSDPEAREEFQMIQRNADRLYSMINELLELYKLESGHIKLAAEKVEIVGLTRRQVASFESYVTQKHIRLAFHSEVKECYVFVDLEKLEKIISNLLSNAIKFTDDQGEVNVTLTCSESELKISVADTGIGIPADKIAHVFDRFYQVDDTDKRGYEGTGIGLSICRELVELHHGKIWVNSELKKGSVFTFTIPKGADHLKPGEIKEEVRYETVGLPEIAGEANDDTPVVPTPEDDQNATTLPIVLIVEDNTDMRKYIRNCLDSNLYSIVEAKNGKEGLSKAIEKIPDLIISDLMMPGLSGTEMCRMIKTDERTSHIPVIMVTARAAIEHKIEGIETGADAYLSKPFNAEELRVRVRKLIEQRRKLMQSFMQNFSPGLYIKHQEVKSVDQLFIQKAIGVVEKYISDSEFSVEMFSQEMALSRVQLHRKLKALTGQSSSHFIRTIRLKTAADFLAKKGGNIKEAAYKHGFNNLSYFDKCFLEEFGMTPTEYIAKQTDG